MIFVFYHYQRYELDEKSNPAVLLEIGRLFLLIFSETYFIDFPLNQIELLVVVINSNEFHQDLFSMRNIFFTASITIWKIRPTSFRNVGVIINDKIIPKTRSILAMHCNHKLFLIGCKFEFGKGVTQPKYKGLL